MERLEGIVTNLYQGSGRGTIRAQRNSATMLMSFYRSDAPAEIKTGDRVSFVPGQFKAEEITLLPARDNVVIFVDFKTEREWTNDPSSNQSPVSRTSCEPNPKES